MQSGSMRAACWLHYQEWFVFHDLSNRKALSRHCGPQEEHQSGRNSLEIIKRDCDLPGHDLGGPARHNRFQAKSRKSIISYSPIRVERLSQETCNSRQARRHRSGAVQPYPNIALKFNRHRPPLVDQWRRSKVHGFTHKSGLFGNRWLPQTTCALRRMFRRFSDAVATSREDHRSPTPDRAVQHPQWMSLTP
jgi:hypothetical protein